MFREQEERKKDSLGRSAKKKKRKCRVKLFALVRPEREVEEPCGSDFCSSPSAFIPPIQLALFILPVRGIRCGK